MTTYRRDYQPFAYQIPFVDLQLDLDTETTRVQASLSIVRKAGLGPDTPLVLNGEDITLESVSIDGHAWPAKHMTLADGTLTLTQLPETCRIDIISTCCPKTNDSLMGLYLSGASLFTQCEPQGFRRIAWFADRPDVMSEYRVTLRADKAAFPRLLSNGNLTSQTDLPDGRHESCWHDPFPKPSYLFALVAGTFDCREKSILTRSGKPVVLQIYSDPGTFDKTAWAMASLERALRWDEERFDLELDLERFMIVAARDFNMGAMENKGLNIFNSAYVLADANTATDANFQGIEAVIGHEYFHNWTGNRVTCRDWFELSLKEGLTVFRDQEFTADMLAGQSDPQTQASARAVKRIDDVVMLRAAQFPEDAGPMAHPIRPESYEEISNFYTATVYEKGAEVIRMMHTLLGERTFQAGMKIYFERHDGQAVTCEDFVNAMQSAWQAAGEIAHLPSLEIFRHWYSQAGTPSVTVSISHSDQDGQCILTLAQACPIVGVEKESHLQKQPFHIPLAIGFVDPNLGPLTLKTASQTGQTLVLELTQEKQSWAISGVTKEAIISLNRGFSAPVIVQYDHSTDDLLALIKHDPDPFMRWEALQTLYKRYLLDTSTGGSPSPEALLQACQWVLKDGRLDPAFQAQLLTLPTDKYLLQHMQPMDPLRLAAEKSKLEKVLGKHLQADWSTVLAKAPAFAHYEPSPKQAGARAIKNTALMRLCQADAAGAKQLAKEQYAQAFCMTDRLAALRALLHHPVCDDSVTDALTDFYEQFQADPLVIDKWFTLQATAPGMSVDGIRGLMAHPSFDRRNPNRYRALVFQFCMNNPGGFHAQSGQGYALWAQEVCQLDAANPELAARLARVMDHWTHHQPALREGMQAALRTVAAHENLSNNTREIVTKALSL